MRFNFVNYDFIIYSIFIFQVSLVSSSSLDDFFPYTSLTEDMRRAGFGDGIKDYNFVFPKKVNANDLHLSHFYPIDESQASKIAEQSPSYLLALSNKDNSEELELPIELQPTVELAPRSLVIERLDEDSRLDIGKAKLQRLGDHRCYYVGHISGQPKSTVALSTCGKGLIGIVQLRDDRFYIEPLTTGEVHGGKNPHVVYRKKPSVDRKQMHCLIKEPIEEPDKRGTGSLVGGSEMLIPLLSNSAHLHDIHNFEKNTDVFSRIEPEIENFPLEENADNLHLNSTYAYNEPKDIDSQTYNLKEEILQANFDEEVSIGGNLQNEMVRARRSCPFMLQKKKLEPVYDVRVLLVVSKHFSELLVAFDVETLILTLMNIVHLHFQDATIGQLLYVKVVRIINIQYDMKELNEKKNSLEDLFANFCKFQERVNPVLSNHPNRHDIAIFLTHKCGSTPVYGVTYSKSVCREDKKCILVFNHGLLTANIITHALGHSLGAIHDDGGEGSCQCVAEDGTNHLMAPKITYEAISWSQCSRQAISRFVRHHAAKCLPPYSKPVNFKWTTEVLPGEVYTASQQCTLNYRMPSLACFSGDFCKRLYCKMNEEECVSNGEPPADGTYCAKDRWCIKGECLWQGMDVERAINGGWSDWSEWSSCSRHCGTGVQRAKRYCNNPPPATGGKICAGRRTRYRVCNQHMPCPISNPSYRDEQCQTTASSYALDEVRVDWHEWMGPATEEVGCSLVCESFTGVVAVRDVAAANGTPCRPGTNDLCIRGECIPVGCDWAFGSRARRDACGICRGGGTTCQIIQGVYTEKNGTGYVPFMKVPRGSSMIFVKQMKPSDATLVVSSSKAGEFYLNGPLDEDDPSPPALSKRFGLAGAPAIYKVKGGMERLFIDGTVQEELIFYLKFGNQGNPGVRYQLAMNRDPKSVFEPSYSWKFIKWDQCSSVCGGGFQVSEPMCVEETNGLVDDSYCPDGLKPMPITRLCNLFPCKPRWWVGPWSKCFKRSNRRIKTRAVLCILSQDFFASSFRIIKDSQCAHVQKPYCSKICNKSSADPSVEGVCNDDDIALQPNSIKYSGKHMEPSYMGENDLILNNNKWNRRISNFHTNDYINNEPYFNFEHKPSHKHVENILSYLENNDDDDYDDEISVVPNESMDSQLSEQIIKGDNSKVDTAQWNSPSLQKTNVISSSGHLRILSEFDDWEGNTEREEYGRVQGTKSEIYGKIKRRKKSYKSKNKKAKTSNDDDIFDQFFHEADDSLCETTSRPTVRNAIKQTTIYDVFDEYSTAANEKTNTEMIIENNSRKNIKKSEISDSKDVNSNLKSKEVKKSTSTSSNTLYGLMLPNKLGEPPNLKISKLQLNKIDSIYEKNTSQPLLPDKIQSLMHSIKNRIQKPESTTTGLIEVVASEEKQKMRCCEAAPFSLATGPTCISTEVTTCPHMDACIPSATPETPKKICHEIIEKDPSSFTLIRAPIACERFLNAYNDGLYEGDGLLSLLPVVNETCTSVLTGDAAIRYIEDRRKLFPGPIKNNMFATE